MDKSISLSDVKQFFRENVHKTNQLKGFNSFVAPHAKYEYQADLFYVKYLQNQSYTIGMLMVDIFTKYMVVVPIKSTGNGDVAAGLIECLKKMGGKPEILYFDGETTIRTSVAIDRYLKEQNIKLIITLTSAWFAERCVRTFKHALSQRIENSKDPNIQWTDFIYEILLTYNNKTKHSVTKFTPTEAREQSNELNVKLNLLMHKQHTTLNFQLVTK